MHCPAVRQQHPHPLSCTAPLSSLLLPHVSKALVVPLCLLLVPLRLLLVSFRLLPVPFCLLLVSLCLSPTCFAVQLPPRPAATQLRTSGCRAGHVLRVSHWRVKRHRPSKPQRLPSSVPDDLPRRGKPCPSPSQPSLLPSPPQCLSPAAHFAMVLLAPAMTFSVPLSPSPLPRSPPTVLTPSN